MASHSCQSSDRSSIWVGFQGMYPCREAAAISICAYGRIVVIKPWDIRRSALFGLSITAAQLSTGASYRRPMLLSASLILDCMTHHPHEAYEDAKVLIMAKTYPTHSREYDELVCTAGLRIDKIPYTFIRLYPIPYRLLSHDSQYAKWEIIDVRIRKRDIDHRPESFEVEADSIRPTGKTIKPDDGWRKRCSYLRDFFGQTDSCKLLHNAKANKTGAKSLALVKPREIEKVTLSINPDYQKARDKGISEEEVLTLFGPEFHRVYPSPVSLKYKYYCQDPDCRSHTQSVIDWEVQAAAYKRWEDNDPREALEFIKDRFINHFKDRDLWLFVGNVHKRPADFMILSFFYPERGVIDLRQSTLFA